MNTRSWTLLSNEWFSSSHSSVRWNPSLPRVTPMWEPVFFFLRRDEVPGWTKNESKLISTLSSGKTSFHRGTVRIQRFNDFSRELDTRLKRNERLVDFVEIEGNDNEEEERKDNNSNRSERVNLSNWFVLNEPPPPPPPPEGTKHHLLDDDREEAEDHCRPRPVLYQLHCPGLIFIH